MNDIWSPAPFGSIQGTLGRESEKKRAEVWDLQFLLLIRWFVGYVGRTFWGKIHRCVGVSLKWEL